MKSSCHILSLTVLKAKQWHILSSLCSYGVHAVSILYRIGKKASYLFNSVPGVEPFFSAVEWERPEPERKRREKKKDSESVASLEAQKVMHACLCVCS